MLNELLAAMEAAHSARKLEDWAVEVRPEAGPGGCSAILVMDEDKQPVGKAWYDVRSNGTHLMYTNATMFTGISEYGKVLKDGWDERVAIAVSLALVATAVLPDRALVPFLKEKDLVPGGTLPKDRAVREFLHMVTKDLESMGDRYSKERVALRAVLRDRYPVVGDLVLELTTMFEGIREEKVRKVMKKVREGLRELVSLGAEFEGVRQAWDEEYVRSVQES